MKEPCVEGLSLMGLFHGGNLEERPLYWHYPHYHHTAPYSAVRYGDWKLVEMLEDNRLFLYNLKDDIGESRDLSGEYPETVSALYRMLDSWRSRIGAQYPVPNPGYDAGKAWKKKRKR